MTNPIEERDHEAATVHEGPLPVNAVPQSSSRHVGAWQLILRWAPAILLLVWAVDGNRPWEDALLVSLLVITTGSGTRSIAYFSAITLVWMSDPPLQVPTYWFCLMPLAWAWRSEISGFGGGFGMLS